MMSGKITWTQTVWIPSSSSSPVFNLDAHRVWPGFSWLNHLYLWVYVV
jgi:hypothetical protein